MHLLTKTLICFVIIANLPVTAWGWDLSKHSIPLDDIMSGGPPRDGIPALTDPDYVRADQAVFLREDEQVLGVFLNGVARAYPTRILSWHEIVNDRFGRLPVLVSW